MKHLKSLLFALLILGLQSCTTNVSNSPLSSNALPLEAPYGGLKGEIDSVVSKSYLIVDGVKSNTPRENTIMVYDKNGYVISNTYQLIESDGKLWYSKNRLMKRDEKSCIVGIETSSNTDSLTLELDEREGDVSYFKITNVGGDLAKYGEIMAKYNNSVKYERIVQIIDREKRTMTTRKGDLEGAVNNIIRFDDMGRVVFSQESFTLNDIVAVESTSEYDDKGLLIHSSTETQFSADSTKNTLSNTYYQNYVFETEAPHNWISREKVDDKGVVTRIDEQKIYYRNRK